MVGLVSDPVMVIPIFASLTVQSLRSEDEEPLPSKTKPFHSAADVVHLNVTSFAFIVPYIIIAESGLILIVEPLSMVKDFEV
jgi:hypothetical protein